MTHKGPVLLHTAPFFSLSEVEDYCHGAVVDEANGHIGTKHSGRDLAPGKALQLGHIELIEPGGQLMSGGMDIARPVSLYGRQREV